MIRGLGRVCYQRVSLSSLVVNYGEDLILLLIFNNLIFLVGEGNLKLNLIKFCVGGNSPQNPNAPSQFFIESALRPILS